MNLIHIDNFDIPGLDVYARFSENELFHFHEPEPGIFIAESPKVIERALKAGYEAISFLLDENDTVRGEMSVVFEKYKDIISDVPVYTACENVLTGLTGFRLARGALCAMRRKKLMSVSQVCDGASRIVVLENVMNPTNVGAIFRSAAALNMEGVLLTRGSSDPLYRRAVRVSMGNVFQVPWTFIEAGNCVDLVHELGFKSAAMALHKESVDIDDNKLKSEKKLAIILGSEGEGLLEETIDKSDYTIKIPMTNDVDSLNVAAASAVAFWELGKR